MKKVTSKDVARVAGVSQSLVSLILNQVPDKKIKQETRDHVNKVAAELGYKVNVNARNMKSSRASSIGLFSEWDTNSFIFPPVISTLKTICAEKDLSITVCSGKTNSSNSYDFVDYYLQNRIDGIIYISRVGVKKEGIIETLEKVGLPFVCISGARELDDVSSVDVNYEENGYIAIKTLKEQGYSRVAFILDNKLQNLNYAEKERLQGCNRGAEEFGLELKAIENFVGWGKEEASYLNQGEEFLKSGDFDAVIGVSYKCYIILKAAARINIKVPQDLGVISLDNELFAPYVYPSLTTVDEPLHHITEKAANILLDKINGDTNCVKLECSPTVTERESTRRVENF